MDLKTVLTSSVIAAIITGLLSLITNFKPKKMIVKLSMLPKNEKIGDKKSEKFVMN